MKTTYTVTWKSKSNAKLSGMNEFIFDEDSKHDTNLRVWAETSLINYISNCRTGDIPPNDTALSYFVYHEIIAEDDIEFLSVFKTITDRSQIDNDISDAIKQKIQKLLNLSMSSNAHEAQLAMEKAYRLMQKHSINRKDLDEQEFLMFKMTPKGKRIASWEIVLYQSICEVGGVFFSYKTMTKGDDIKPTMYPSLNLLGRKNDVLNASYLIECYKREIERVVQETKKKHKLGRKEANDYRQGLIVGISIKLLNEKDRFFTSKTKKGNDIVSVDARIDEAKKLFTSVKSKSIRTPKVDRAAFNVGLEDSKRITIRNAAEDKGATKMKLPKA